MIVPMGPTKWQNKNAVRVIVLDLRGSEFFHSTLNNFFRMIAIRFIFDRLVRHIESNLQPKNFLRPGSSSRKNGNRISEIPPCIKFFLCHFGYPYPAGWWRVPRAKSVQKIGQIAVGVFEKLGFEIFKKFWNVVDFS